MECNKDEAIRARGIAKAKMEKKDFMGGRKFVLKAQQLYPDLENVSQMLMVCNVLCSAEENLFGNEKDWYGILQIEPTADECFIRKQYRKFALLLHPDKNKAAGAADAFKLIVEAQNVLLDREKRMSFDSKCKASGRYKPSCTRQTSMQTSVSRQPCVRNNAVNNFSSSSMNQSQLCVRNNAVNNFSSSSMNQSQQPAQFDCFNRPTFWTMCPFCGVKYQYYRDVMNRLISCQNCQQHFKGYEVNIRCATSATKCSQHVIFKQPVSRSQKNVKVEPQCTTPNATKVGAERSVDDDNPGIRGKMSCSFEVRGKSKPDVNSEFHVESQPGGPKQMQMNGNGREKDKYKFHGSYDTGNGSKSQENVVTEEASNDLPRQNSGGHPEKLSSSTFSTKHFSINENLNDSDVLSRPSKRKVCEEFSSVSQPVEDALPKNEAYNTSSLDDLAVNLEKHKKKVKKDKHFCADSAQNGEEKTKLRNRKEVSSMERGETFSGNLMSSSSSRSNTSLEYKVYDCDDSDFCDFDSSRNEACFAVNQIWALYDTLDAMPRFYAQIGKVVSPGFKVQVTWLEAAPDDKNEIEWAERGLPIACGKFKLGTSDWIESENMFSHLVSWKKGSGKNSYVIFPRKGETWALFKNWDLNWHSDMVIKKKSDFEFVEVLSDYTDKVGVQVAYLGKIKGFASLFCRTKMQGVDSVSISQQELFRFSHRVPSFQMNKQDRADVPKGSYELDPASLPASLEAIVSPEILKVESLKMHSSSLCSKPLADNMKSVDAEEVASAIFTTSRQESERIHLSSSSSNPDEVKETCHGATVSPDMYLVPDPVFYNFSANKSQDKFQVGQFWALYSEEDSFPKYYGRIKKIDYQPEFKVYLNWLCPGLQPKDMLTWLNEDMLLSCGKFKLQRGETEEYTHTDMFSHQIVADKIQRDAFVIYPRKGEVWALYKDLNVELTLSELKSCEYDVVEVVEEDESWISVVFLEPASGFESVFRPKKKGRYVVKRNVPMTELLKFSHQIPAYRLTGERKGKLRGFLELDTAAMPFQLFN